ncbi:MAG: hypothetical protein AMS19_08305 [Gemmatimonas sp. SG8_23]|nr:MAG: hypothetical protein AMS19_08305 [Gemmatimonas sp. SG8_23]
MKKPGRLAILFAAVPFLGGCFTVATVPVPATAPEREDTDFQGVVVRQVGGGEETVVFDEVLEATWTPTSLSVVGQLPAMDDGAPGETVTRLFPISTLAGLRVRKLDAGKTSALVGGVFLVAAAIIASQVSGTAGY